MKFGIVSAFVSAALAASLVSQARAETVQTPANVFSGHPFLYVEGESASAFNAPVDGMTWKIATKGGPDMSTNPAPGTPVPIVPLTSNVSGSAIYATTNDFSTAHSRTAIYQLKFITAGTYQFYLRQSLYD